MNSLRIYNPQQVSNTVTSLQLLTAKRFCFRTWDICGQDVFHSLINSFYKRANLTILVYAIDDRESFESLEFWLGEIRTYSRKSNKIVLVGNKKDLEGAKLYVTLFPCNECTKLIIQNGIKEIIYLSDKYANTDGTKASKIMLNKCEVKFTEFSEEKSKKLVLNLKK